MRSWLSYKLEAWYASLYFQIYCQFSIWRRLAYFGCVLEDWRYHHRDVSRVLPSIEKKDIEKTLWLNIASSSPIVWNSITKAIHSALEPSRYTTTECEKLNFSADISLRSTVSNCRPGSIIRKGLQNHHKDAHNFTPPCYWIEHRMDFFFFFFLWVFLAKSKEASLWGWE